MIYRGKHGFFPKSGPEQLTLNELLPSFQVFLGLHVLAFFVFICELLVHKIQSQYNESLSTQIFKFTE